MRISTAALLSAACVLIAGFSLICVFSPAALAEDKLTVTTGAFTTGAAIPAKFSGDGADVSPAISWSGVPEKAKSLAITCTDPDAPGGTWWHWIVFNLPTATTQLTEGQAKTPALAGGASQGTNDFGNLGYNGPAPPKGALHHYHFTVHALDKKLSLKAGCNKDEITAALKGHVLARGEYVGTYIRH